jgi:hypothetical protein
MLGECRNSSNSVCNGFSLASKADRSDSVSGAVPAVGSAANTCGSEAAMMIPTPVNANLRILVALSSL